MKREEYEIRSYANLNRADMRGANLDGANLNGADMRRADMRDTNLDGANLNGADMRGADMRDANLNGADMRRADMRDADMRGSDMRGANLDGANLNGADMRDAEYGNIKGWKRPPLLCSPNYGPWNISEYGNNEWKIGCKVKTVSQWVKYYTNVNYNGSLDAHHRELYIAEIRHLARQAKRIDNTKG